MKTYMLDTNICSYIIRRNPDVIRKLEEETQFGEAKIVISSVAYAELMHGAANPRAPKSVLRDIRELVLMIDGIIPLDASDVELSAAIQHELLKSGEQIGFNDSLIAAQAIRGNCICVTNNTREFARVPGLMLENWTAHH